MPLNSKRLTDFLKTIKAKTTSNWTIRLTVWEKFLQHFNKQKEVARERSIHSRLIHYFRASVSSSMSWCAGPYLSTEPTCNVWGIEFSPGGSGSLSSCPQVSCRPRPRKPGRYFVFHQELWISIIHYIVLICPNYTSECESLIRKILVLDPGRRMSLQQIKTHPWMQAEVRLTQWGEAWRLGNVISSCQFYQ